MASLNRVSFIGNLGADPEMRYTPGGEPVTNFRIGVNERGQDGKPETMWLRAVVWGKGAESCMEFLAKGSLVCINGRLAIRKYLDNEKVERQSTEVVCDPYQGVVFLDRKADTGG